MDSDTEYDMLDLLAYNCNQMSAQLRKTTSNDEQEKIIQDHLKKVDKEFKPVNEIQDGLYLIIHLQMIQISHCDRNER